MNEAAVIREALNEVWYGDPEILVPLLAALDALEAERDEHVAAQSTYEDTLEWARNAVEREKQRAVEAETELARKDDALRHIDRMLQTNSDTPRIDVRSIVQAALKEQR